MERYRCSGCGNLTRFDVVARRRTRSFHHYDLSGVLVVEEEQLLEEEIEEVACRWCGSSKAVEELQAAEAAEPMKGSADLLVEAQLGH